MIYYNTGYIQVKEEDVKALIVAINATEIFGFDLDVTDFYKHCGMAVYDLCEITGDIEDNLQEVKKLLNTVGIEVDFEITFSGDSNGKYIVNDDGEFEVLSLEDSVIRDAYTDDLIKELQKRGYSVTKAGGKNGTENNGNLS